jgi:hypothetical protein
MAQQVIEKFLPGGELPQPLPSKIDESKPHASPSSAKPISVNLGTTCERTAVWRCVSIAHDLRLTCADGIDMSALAQLLTLDTDVDTSTLARANTLTLSAAHVTWTKRGKQQLQVVEQTVMASDDVEDDAAKRARLDVITEAPTPVITFRLQLRQNTDGGYIADFIRLSAMNAQHLNEIAQYFSKHISRMSTESNSTVANGGGSVRLFASV